MTGARTSSTRYSAARQVSLWSLTWAQLFCLFLFRLPRIVPRVLLRYTTSTEAPYPQVLRLPSRDSDREIYCWIFLPELDRSGDDSASSSLPVLVDFHGGGFTSGELAEQAPWCSLFSRRLRAAVITVDYRLGPLSKYPSAVHDAEDVVRACRDETWPGYNVLRRFIDRHYGSFEVDVDTRRIATSGFSSGGNLSLNLLVSTPDWPSPLEPAKHPHHIPALLFYPSLDCRLSPHERPLPPDMERSDGLLSWIGKAMEGAYLSKSDSGQVRASPGLAGLGGSRDGQQSRRRAVERLVDLREDGHEQGGSSIAGEDEEEAAARAIAEEQRQGGQQQDHSGIGLSSSASNDMLHPRSHSLIILPSRDSLAHQSGLWLQSLADAGRLRSLDEHGFDNAPGSTTSALPGVTALHVQGAPHGWTQFPDFALAQENRRQKYEVFERCVRFAERVWALNEGEQG